MVRTLGFGVFSECLDAAYEHRLAWQLFIKSDTGSARFDSACDQLRDLATLVSRTLEAAELSALQVTLGRF